MVSSVRRGGHGREEKIKKAATGRTSVQHPNFYYSEAKLEALIVHFLALAALKAIGSAGNVCVEIIKRRVHSCSFNQTFQHFGE